MKKIFTFLSMLAITVFVLQAQETKLKVAVFDPSSSGALIDEGTKVAVRELISSTFVNTGKYTIVERSLLQQIMKEQQFSNTDVVDDSQATQLGKLAGANKVVLSVVTLVSGRNMLSLKVIDVQTATVEQQRTKIINSTDLLDLVEPLTLELMGEKSGSTITTPKPAQPVAQPAQTTQPTNTAVPPQNNVSAQRPTMPQEGEIAVYCSGIETEPEPYSVVVFFDGNKIITSTIQAGFALSFKDTYRGKHVIQINAQKFKIDTRKKKMFVFRAKTQKTKKVMKAIAFGVFASSTPKYGFTLEN